MRSGFWIGLGLVLLLLGVVVVMNSGEKASDGGRYGYKDAAKVQKSDHIVKATAAEGEPTVTIIEYGDFQCPGCGALEPILQQVRAANGDKVNFVFRHFPLTQIHQNAMAAHRAAVAADKQGKFWQMHDLLYARQTEWSEKSNASKLFEGYAKELGLDVTKFRQDVASRDVFDRISADLKAGQAFGFTSTPSLIFEGKKLDEIPRTAEAWQKLIDDAIAKKEPKAKVAPVEESTE